MSRDTRDLLVILLGLGVLAYLYVGDRAFVYLRRKLDRARMEAPGWFHVRSLWPLLLALALGAMMRTPSIAVYLFLVGCVFVWRSYERAKLLERAKLNRQVERLVFAFRNVYKLQPVVFAALREVVRRLDEPIRGWVQAMLNAYLATSSEAEAYAALRAKSNNHYLNQFLFILELSGSASVETVIRALDNLSQRLRRYEDLQRETEVELASVVSQTRIIQVIGIIILFIVAAVPTLRQVYVESALAQLVYIFFVTVAVVTSIYIDNRVDRLKESVL